jgi:phosphate starvation-inducible protein PhoH and related proteins
MKETKFGKPLLTTAKNKKLYAKTHNQNELVKSVQNNQITILSGPAGSGKTFISTILAAKALKEGTVEKIVITRPAVEAGEHLGFLPGELANKLDPYLKPIYDVLEILFKKDEKSREKEGQTEAAIKYTDRVEIVPVAFMRGRTFHNSFVIFDEAQNATAEQVRMIMTRLGQNSKMVIDGDVKQSDLGYNNGLKFVINRLEHNPIKDIGLVRMNDNDIIRNKLIADIEKMFEVK